MIPGDCGLRFCLALDLLSYGGQVLVVSSLLVPVTGFLNDCFFFPALGPISSLGDWQERQLLPSKNQIYPKESDIAL